MPRVTIPEIQQMRRDKKKIVVMTAYDYTMARLVDRAGIDIMLVGDSGAEYSLGYEDSVFVTVTEMVTMTRSVVRGTEHAMVVGDMPFMSYQVSKEEAVRNAGRYITEAGAQAVKMEVGGNYAPTVEAVTRAGIPVMAHIGLTPMASIGSGDFRDQGARVQHEQMLNDAKALVDAGAFSLLITGVPAALATEITNAVAVPTIAGFGAGDDCSGVIGVSHNVLGFNIRELDKPRANYGPVGVAMHDAAKSFAADVRAGKPVRSRRDQAG
jgi:3-methyl-2-oxobutanoate hydroxymethyltransferase